MQQERGRFFLRLLPIVLPTVRSMKIVGPASISPTSTR